MPELPEVETVKRTLEKQIVGKVIKDVEVYYDKMLENTSATEFIEILKGEKLCSFYRYGKYLVFLFEHVSLISHLRMEGKYFIKQETEERVKHEHIIFKFTDSSTLRYHDTRKFGIMAIIKSTKIEDIMNYKGIAKLGEEASVSTNYEALYNKLKTKNLPIKTLLLDQENICGLGNIYVDEVLFKSEIHPLTRGNDLTIEQVKTILDNSRIVLANAIACGGTTIRSYTSSLGVTGRFQINLNVHTKENEPCPKCGTIIKKIKVGGRGTYFCPTCQKVYVKVKCVGITGLISSGKTAVTDYLSSLGYPVIDADVISRKLLAENSKYLDIVIEELKTKWGESLVDTFYEDKKVNRRVLGKIVFEDPIKRQDLNNVMHPIIKKIIKSDILKQKNAIIKKIDCLPFVFISVPLLFEAHYDDLCNHIMIVSCEKEVLIERLMKRDNIDRSYAETKINSQMSLEDKIQKSVELQIPYSVIDNSTTLDKTYQIVDEVLKNI